MSETECFLVFALLTGAMDASSAMESITTKEPQQTASVNHIAPAVPPLEMPNMLVVRENLFRKHLCQQDFQGPVKAAPRTKAAALEYILLNMVGCRQQ